MSDYLIDQYKQLHEQNSRFGTRVSSAEYIRDLSIRIDCESVLDYGCGKGRLVEKLRSRGITTEGYDPAVPPWDTPPKTAADLVICTDVLEHIPEDELPVTLTAILEVARKAVLLGIVVIQGDRLLPDGQAAHITVKPLEWWGKKIKTLTPTWKVSRLMPFPVSRTELVMFLLQYPPTEVTPTDLLLT